MADPEEAKDEGKLIEGGVPCNATLFWRNDDENNRRT
jgi:hypothetical protein